MIRGAVVHMINEQPLLADLQALPTPTDVALVCTNLRLMNGRRPSFADHIDSLFLIPMSQVRFIEVYQRALQAGEWAATPTTGSQDDAALDLEPDADFLRRIREA